MPGTPRAAVVALYHPPADAAEFERYYDATHIPLVSRHAAALGIERVELAKLSPLGGEPAPFYRKAELWFASEDAMRQAMARPEFTAIADDLPRFATGGVIVLTSVETHA